MINYEEDRVQSVTQTDAAKTLSDKVIELKDLEDEIENAEESLSKLKEKARYISNIEVPQMMEEMHITKLKLKDGESVEIKKIYGASITPDNQEQAFTWGLNQSRKLVFILRHSKQWSESVLNLDNRCPLIFLKLTRVTVQK
jgi:hypothetical protein